MGLNHEEINKVNLLYKENDALKSENANLRAIVERLDKLEASITAKLDEVLTQSHTHD
ncbi:hypothetical protein H8E06_00150 [bacterium]|nr:hypothetical protein [bacterium]